MDKKFGSIYFSKNRSHISHGNVKISCGLAERGRIIIVALLEPFKYQCCQSLIQSQFLLYSLEFLEMLLSTMSSNSTVLVYRCLPALFVDWT